MNMYSVALDVVFCTPSFCRWVAGGAYHLCSVHVLCVCVLFVMTCCVYPACLCGRVCCVTRTLEVDMALLSVSRLMCGTWSLE